MAKLRSCGIIFLFFTITSAEDFTPQKQYNFAYELLQNREYESAINEFKRYLVFFPDGKEKDQAKFYIGLSYYLNNNKDGAIEYWETTIDSIEDLEYKRNLIGFLFLTYIELDKPAAVEELLERYELYYSTLQIETVKLWNKIIKYDFSNAVSYAKNLFNETTKKTFYDIQRYIEKIKVPKKSPVIAGILSIIPGAGYLYLGRVGDSAFIFIFNSLFTYLLIDAIRNRNLFTTVLWGTIESSWYFANIYGSIRDAKKHNIDKLNQLINDLKLRYLKLNFCEMDIISGSLLQEI